MFKNQSKFRHSIISPDKKQSWISFDSNPFVNAPDLCPISASKSLLAVRTGSGSSISICPVDAQGRTSPVVLSNSSFINHLDWSPTCSQSTTRLLAATGNDGLKLYSISQSDDLNVSLTKSCNSMVNARPAYFHPTANDLIAIGNLTYRLINCSLGHENSISIWNYEKEDTVFKCDTTQSIQSMSWKGDGSMLATYTSDNHLRVFDPRVQLNAITEVSVHDGVKPALIAWCGDSDRIFSVGLNKRRNREYAVWDIRNSSNPLTLQNLDQSQGITIPLFDSDTNQMFLCGKGDSRITWLELNGDFTIDSTRLPIAMPVPIGGACLLPKLAMDVMSCQFARTMIVTATVPRKSHIEFHADIFPDTKSEVLQMSVEDWLKGLNITPNLVSLNPSLAKSEINHKKTDKNEVQSASVIIPSHSEASSTINSTLAHKVTEQPSYSATSSAINSKVVQNDTKQVTMEPKTKPAHPVSNNLPRYSAFRHVETNVKIVYEGFNYGNITPSNETNAFQVNEKYIAFWMSGSGGLVDLNDFKFDPFQSNRIVSACDDGKLRIFSIPLSGLTEDLMDPIQIVPAHTNRISIIAFHPSIKDLLMSSSIEQTEPTVKLWNLETNSCLYTIPQTDMVHSCAFKLDGTLFATSTRDKKISTFNLRTGKAVTSGPSHSGSKTSRLTWIDDSNCVCSVGFSNGSQREILLYDERDLSKPLSITSLDISPSILIPFYDLDTKLLVLTGKGESTLSYYEIVDQTVVSLDNKHGFSSVTTSVSFVPKLGVDVMATEIVKGYRLTSSTIETLSVVVPRVKKEYFQSMKQMFESAQEAASGPLEQDLLEGVEEDEWD
ncbi:Coronin-7 [Globomyces sp. JEL0801]|nr:Coronin-7 [Globomyces sp. JEL0801]